MNTTLTRVICLVLCLSMTVGFAGCTPETDALAEKALTAIAENEQLQAFLAEYDLASITDAAVTKIKEIAPALKEFLAREDVQEKFRTVGLPMIKEFLNYGIESMRLKAETLGKIICIFAPELTAAVDEIFATAPQASEVPETTLAPTVPAEG